MNYGFVMDNTSCIGCHACSTACKSENEVPLGVHRTWVKYTEAGRYPDVRRAFQVTRCNHCANPPCVRICPTGAMMQRADGIVEFDSDACIGCKACMQACPYDAIYIDPESHTAAKCHYCAHRIDVGLEPACVVVCPEHAIIAGDLDDPASEISRVLAKHNVTVRKPEQGTSPKLFYIEGNELSLTPTATTAGASFVWAETHGGQPPKAGRPQSVRQNDRGQDVRVPQHQGLNADGPIQIGARMAEHMVQVAYNVQHEHPWHWPIPLYLITKHISAGIFVFLALAVLLGLRPDPSLFFAGGLLSLPLLAVTLALLVYDLDRPDRFFYLLLRPQWRSWVARAAWILTAFSALAGGWWALETAAHFGWLATPHALRPVLALITLPLSVMAAIYTAYLFAQAEGRDLWQGTHVPLQMLLQALALGALPFVALGAFADVPSDLHGLARALSALGLTGSALTTLIADLTIAQPSEVARRANHAMTHGKWRTWFWWGGIGLGHVLPLALLTTGVPAQALAAFLFCSIGLFMYAYAFVMAPQEVPNS